MSLRILFASAVLLLGAFSVWAADAQIKKMEIDEDQVTSWNRFAAGVYQLHRQQISGRAVRRVETTAQYSGSAARGYTYRETSYFDAQTGQLLSRVRVDRDHPEILHIVEVFVHDAQGRVQRDYTSIYLPWAHNAPIRTMINVHQYNDKLHAYRQFDASGVRIYEQCKGTLAGRPVDLSLDQEDIDPVSTRSEIYRNCFAGARTTVGGDLIPH